MLTECTPELFEFELLKGRRVVAAFDGGAITSDAGTVLADVLSENIKSVLSGE